MPPMLLENYRSTRTASLLPSQVLSFWDVDQLTLNITPDKSRRSTCRVRMTALSHFRLLDVTRKIRRNLANRT
jgi:hypothetical protein